MPKGGWPELARVGGIRLRPCHPEEGKPTKDPDGAGLEQRSTTENTPFPRGLNSVALAERICYTISCYGTSHQTNTGKQGSSRPPLFAGERRASCAHFRPFRGAPGKSLRGPAAGDGAAPGGPLPGRHRGGEYGQGPLGHAEPSRGHPRHAGLYLLSRGGRLPPGGAEAPCRPLRPAKGRGGDLHRLGFRSHAADHPAPDPRSGGIHSGGGGQLRHRGRGGRPAALRLRQVRAGGGPGPVCPPGRHPGLLLPRGPGAGARGILGGRHRLHGPLRRKQPAPLGERGALHHPAGCGDSAQPHPGGRGDPGQGDRDRRRALCQKARQRKRRFSRSHPPRRRGSAAGRGADVPAPTRIGCGAGC